MSVDARALFMAGAAVTTTGTIAPSTAAIHTQRMQLPNVMRLTLSHRGGGVNALTDWIAPPHRPMLRA
jgi:hypothetical protein